MYGGRRKETGLARGKGGCAGYTTNLRGAQSEGYPDTLSIMKPTEESLEEERPGRRQIRNQTRVGMRNRAIKTRNKKRG